MHRSGILFVISAPSGAGKTTLTDRLRKTTEFTYSVSCTTRAPRKGEVDGKDYHFLDQETFQKRVSEGQFLEFACVHGNFYGTPIQPIKEALANGNDLLLDVDVQGAAQIRENKESGLSRSMVSVFLMTRTIALLEARLRRRGTDSEETIQKRLAAAHEEMSQWNKYDYVIFSGTPEEDEQKFRSIVQAERYRSSRLSLDIV